MTQMLSLYDYLGRAAGPKLGKQVAGAAEKSKQPYKIKHVFTSTYKGEIMMYPKEFLDNYFKQNKI